MGLIELKKNLFKLKKLLKIQNFKRTVKVKQANYEKLLKKEQLSIFYNIKNIYKI